MRERERKKGTSGRAISEKRKKKKPMLGKHAESRGGAGGSGPGGEEKEGEGEELMEPTTQSQGKKREKKRGNKE